jgi:hypothetical protein
MEIEPGEIITKDYDILSKEVADLLREAIRRKIGEQAAEIEVAIKMAAPINRISMGCKVAPDPDCPICKKERQ